MYLFDDLSHRFYRNTGMFVDSQVRIVVFYVSPQDPIEHVVLVQRIGVLMNRPNLGRSECCKYVLRNGAVMSLVSDARKSIIECLGNVADHCQPPAHISIESAVTNSELAFVARSQDECGPFIRKRHQRHAAQTGL